MSIETMKQALDWMEWFAGDDHSIRPKSKALDIAQALRQAIEQEPDKYAMDIECTNCGTKQSGILTVNTTPPQRTWQGLTDEEIKTICLDNGWDSSWQSLRFAQVIEAKLKEKNT